MTSGILKSPTMNFWENGRKLVFESRLVRIGMRFGRRGGIYAQPTRKEGLVCLVYIQIASVSSSEGGSDRRAVGISTRA